MKNRLNRIIGIILAVSLTGNAFTGSAFAMSSDASYDSTAAPAQETVEEEPAAEESGDSIAAEGLSDGQEGDAAVEDAAAGSSEEGPEEASPDTGEQEDDQAPAEDVQDAQEDTEENAARQDAGRTEPGEGGQDKDDEKEKEAPAVVETSSAHISLYGGGILTAYMHGDSGKMLLRAARETDDRAFVFENAEGGRAVVSSTGIRITSGGKTVYDAAPDRVDTLCADEFGAFVLSENSGKTFIVSGGELKEKSPEDTSVITGYYIPAEYDEDAIYLTAVIEKGCGYLFSAEAGDGYVLKDRDVQSGADSYEKDGKFFVSASADSDVEYSFTFAEAEKPDEDTDEEKAEETEGKTTAPAETEDGAVQARAEDSTAQAAQEEDASQPETFAVTEEAPAGETLPDEKEKEENGEYRNEYTCKADGASVKAVVSKEGVVPENAELICEKIDEKSEDYFALRAQLAEYYGTTEDAVSIYPYDVRFVYDGMEIEPEDGSVTLEFDLDDPVRVRKEENAYVVHMKDSEDVEVLSDDIVSFPGRIDRFEVEVGSLSPIVITKTNVQGTPLRSVQVPTEDGDIWISKTPNISNNGTASSMYSNRMDTTDTVQIDGAVSVHVDVTYGGEGVGCDYLYIKDENGEIIYTDSNGNPVGAVNSTRKGKIGGAGNDFSGSKSNSTDPAGTVSYDFDTDTLQFVWHTDSSVTGYGYYAVITPVYADTETPDFHFEELEDGTYALVFDRGGEIDAFSMRPEYKELLAEYRDKVSEIRLHKGTTAIKNGAFKNFTALEKVTVPRNPQLREIGKNVFSGCESLETLNIPDSVNSISPQAFKGCSGLKKVAFSASSPITELPSGLFKGLTELEDVVLPQGLTAIPDSMFDGCTSLPDISIPDSVTSIGDYAFRNTAITEVPVIDRLTKIGTQTFYGCRNLTEVNIPAGVTYINTSAFEGCSGITDFIFEEGSQMTTLPANMFKGMTSLTNVVLPESLTRIPNYCFSGCSSLKNVTIPEGVSAIGDYAFESCTKMQDFEIPSGIKSLGAYAFKGCTSLKDVTIPATVTSVGAYLFRGCSNLIRAKFEDGSPVTALPSGMFYDCSRLEYVKLPDNVTLIPASYFYGCTSLTHVDLPERLTSIGDNAFYNCYNITQLDLPGTLKTIGSQAFYNCDGLTGVNVPKSVTSVGSSAWYGCDGIQYVVFEDGSPLTSLGASTFRNCVNLENIVLPSKLTSIPNYMCSGCSKLPDIEIPSKVKTVGSYAFDGCGRLTGVTLPEGLTSIYSYAFRNTGLKDIELPHSLGSVGDYAFYKTKITELEVPNQVTSLGAYSFAECGVLESVVFEEGGRNCSIGNYAFSNDCSISELSLKKGITTIGSYAFQNNRRLDEVTIPQTVTAIQSYAFYNDTGIRKIEFLPSSSTLMIGSGTDSRTFAGLTNIEEIVIDRNISSGYKSENTFANLNPDAKFTIGKNVDTLDNMFVSMFNDRTMVTFEGENDFSVTTRISNTSEDMKWSQFKGDFYVDPEGVVYRLNKAEGTASLFFIPDGIQQYTVPAEVTSVAGAVYRVTFVDSYAARDAADLESLVFEDPSSVEIPQFAFTGCSSLQTINGKTELYPEEWTGVSTMCGFPVHSDDVAEQVLTLQDSIELGPAEAGGEAPKFSFGVTISGQEKMDEDGLTYVYKTGQSARLDFAVSNESNFDMSDRVIRIYYAFDGDNYTMGSYVPGQDYTLVNTATGARYPFKVRATDAAGIYYYDITGFKPGDTLAFNNNFAYLSPKSAGGTMRIWVESITAQEAQSMEGKVSEPGKYILAEWYTQPVPYKLGKKVSGNPTFEFTVNQTDESDDNIYVKNMSYAIDMKSTGESGTAYAKDYIRYVDFSDDLLLPEGMVWSPDVVQAVRDGAYYTDNSRNVYVKISGSWVKICQLSVPSADCFRGLSLEVVQDRNGNDAVRINWSYRNTYWTDVRTAPTADMPATSYTLTLGERAVQVKKDSPLWNMLREGEEVSDEVSEAMRKIANRAEETTHYSFSEDLKDEAEAPERLVYMATGFKMTKEMTGSGTFGMPHGYRISLSNTGLMHKEDIAVVEDALREHYYIEAEDMEEMFRDRRWGPFARIDITSVTLCGTPDRPAVDIYGNEIGSQTAQQSGMDPIPYSGCARAGSDVSETTANAKLSFYWNDDRTMIIMDVKDDAGNVHYSYTVGDGGDYDSIQSAIDGIGYVVTYRAAYTVTWDLGDGYTLYNAAKDGVQAENIAELTDEQVRRYRYKLKSGRTDVFLIPSRVKKTTMWLTEDELGHYHSSSISSSNTAYARHADGSQAGSASWTGNVNRELSLDKRASVNGVAFDNRMNVPDCSVIDYSLSFTNSGETYDLLPLTDKMGGSQVLLVPVMGNRNAEYCPAGGSPVSLQSAGLDIYDDGGVRYYILDKEGVYKNVTIDGRITDTIQVTRGSGTATTLMIWYYQNVTGKSGNASSVTRSISYKALADSARLGGQQHGEDGSTITSRSLANETWLGGHQTHRLYDSLPGEVEQLQFIKWIVEDPESEREHLIRHSLVLDDDEVLYKIIIKNTGKNDVTLTGNHIHDELPSTSGIFPWSKDNVTDIYYVTDGLGSSTQTTGPEYWYINSDQPGTHADTASRGLYYIYWTDDFRIHFDPESEIWIYVKVKFPGSEDLDPVTGERNNYWDRYITKNNGAIITNYFYIDERESDVTHELIDIVEGKLQKGVLDTGLSRSGYFQSEDTRHFYQNGGNVDNGSVQEVAYYTVLYNSGNVRLYLDPLRDQLPKGFKFRGLINCIPKAANTGAGFNTSYSTWSYNSLGSYYNGFSTLNYTEHMASNSSYMPLASVRDENRASVVYKNAKVTASTAMDGEDHQQVTFEISRNSNSDSYLRYDSTLKKYYLNPGEAVRFGYICTVEGYARTENLAFNEVAMPVYDKYGLGTRVSGEEVTVTPAVYRDIAVNDGGCEKLTTEEESKGRLHERSSWVKNTTEWFSSNVSLQRLEAVPGILKTVGGETMIPSTTQILPDRVYGSKYTDGNKGGTPYVGTVARTSVVNWELRIYNEGGIGSNSMEDYWIVDTVDAPYRFTGNYFYDYFNVNGTQMTSSSVPVFSLGGRSENDTTVKISTGQGSGTMTLNGTLTINGDPVAVDGGRATVQILRDENGVETLLIHMLDNSHRIPPNSYMRMYAHTQYLSSDAVLSKQFYNHVQLEPAGEFDPALVTKGKVLYHDVDGDQMPFAIESGASVTMTAGYTSAARKQITEIGNTSNTGWSDRDKNYIVLPEKYSKFYYDLYVDLPKDDPTSKLVMIDALPEPGDHSPFVDRDMRDSEFFVHLLSEDLGLRVWASPNLGAGQKKELTTAQYSFEVSEKTSFAPEDWDGGGEGWRAVSISDGLSEEEAALVENARSFRVILDDPSTVSDPAHALMGKNYQVQVRLNAELLYPEDTDPGAIAWNSFGYRYTVPIGATGISTSLNAEPLKVGVLIPSVPKIIKDQKTPLNHYKNAAEDTQYRFLIYTGTAIHGLNDISGMSMEDIAGILSENGRDTLITSLTVRQGEASGQSEYLDDEHKWVWNGDDFEETQDHWIWNNAGKYTVIELPWEENGYAFDNIQHSPVNNYTFSQTVENNVLLRVTNVYERKGSLKLSKTVNGPSFDPDRKFTFTIHMQDGRYPVYGVYEYTGTNIKNGTIAFNDSGNATIQLRHGQAVEILNIPEDFTYTVTETPDEWYACTSKTDDEGSIVSNTVKNAAFTNTRGSSALEIRKTVAGNMGSRYLKFPFEVYITDEGRELTGAYNAVITNDDGTTETAVLNFVEGAAVIHLRHGDTASIGNLPVGAKYEIEELEIEGDLYRKTSTNESGTLTAGTVRSEWINTKSVGVPTGIGMTPIWCIILATAAAGTALFLLIKRRKKV